jgi:photosystem II stability/assembly factor-like uncharacterized protein
MKKILYCLILFLISASSIYSQRGEGFWSASTNSIGRVFAMDAKWGVDMTIIYAASLDSGIYKSSDHGLTWNKVNNGLTYRAVQAIAISPSNWNVVYAGTNQLGGANSGIYVTTNAGASWTLKNTGITEVSLGIQSVSVDPSNSLIAYAAVFDGLTNSTVGLFKTTNGGDSWFASSNGIDIKNILCVSVSNFPNIILAGTSFDIPTQMGPSKIYKSTDGGANWVNTTGLPADPTAINPVRFINVANAPNYFFAGLFMNTTDGGAYFSTDGGSTWTKKWNGAPADVGTLLRSGLIVEGTNEIYVGLDRATGLNIGVWKSSDAGNNWTSANGNAMLDTYAIRGLVFGMDLDGSTIFAGSSSASGNGVYEYTYPIPVELVSFSAEVFSNDVILNWITATETNNRGFDVEKQADKKSWVKIGYVEGNGTTVDLHNYSFADNDISAGNYSYRLKQIDFDGSFTYTDAVEVEILNADSYVLQQNYPNPFNPETRISFGVPAGEHTTLKVTDILGNEVATLLNERIPAGSYEMNFDASALPSGIYFYTLQSGDFAITRKMVLLK